MSDVPDSRHPADGVEDALAGVDEAFEDAILEGRHGLVDLVNRVLDRGVVLHGDVTLSVAGVDLVYLGLGALLTSVSTARRSGFLPARAGPPDRVPGETDAPGATRGATRGRAAGSLSAGRVHPPDRPVEPAGEGSPEDRLAAELVDVARGLPERLDIDPDAVQRDLARLVLTIVELLRRVVEHQAVRRMEDGDLSDTQVERMGAALLRLEEKLQEIRSVFGVAEHELNIDLGPLGKLL
jgi:hypothetical protein